MGVLFKNNAESTLDTAISSSDLGLAVASGDGTLFPSPGAGEYFYLTIDAQDGTSEIVKVTARSSDSMTIVRAQEDTSASAFAAGALLELRITAQGMADKITELAVGTNTVELGNIEQIGAQRVLGAITSGDVAEITASNILDFLSSTRGVIIYRGASGWVALSPGTANQVLKTGGAGADPSWATGTFLSNGDKGDITVSGSSSDAWAVDSGAISLAKMANLAQYSLIGQPASGSAVPQAIATSANVYTMLGSANNAAIRSNIGLGTIATQAASAIAVTGGAIEGLTSFQGTPKLATNTTGTLALADADCVNFMTGNITLNGGVFTAPQAFIFYSGASSRTITEGASMTLRLGGTTTTGSRTLAARTVAVGLVIGTNEIVIAGAGVT